MKRKCCFRISPVFILVLFFSNQLFAQLSPVIDSIPMSDGRKLAADVYIPSGITSGPVILIQTPYSRVLYRFGLPMGIGLAVNSSNYIIVVVDWRGFYGSAGAAHAGAPTRGVDGKSCVEWIAAQTWSNGKVGLWGPSALGDVQFQTAKENPPHLTCMCPLVAAPQYEYEEYYPNGDLRTEYVEQLDGLGFGVSPSIMANSVHNPTWSYVENLNFYPADILVPCFMIGGWYDHNIETMLPFFNAIRTSSPTAVRNEHRLLMGPWVHGGHGTAVVGSSLQGQLSYPNATDVDDSLALVFFDYHLRNIANGWNTTPFVQYYQMGENDWQTSATWPVSGTTPTDFYFHHDGSLTEILPTNSTDVLSFNYDPTDPSPTYGGPTLRQDLDQGPFDQSDTVESRGDVLVFSTPALTQNSLMKGSASVHMKIASNKLDTDFDVRLTDVYPDGRSMLVNDGTFRMRFRDGNTAADTSVMIPNQVYDCVIDLPNTAITFLAGHKIRVDVTSSNYPRFNRNMNTGGPMYPGNSMDSLVNPQIATNSVYTNNVNTSFISLPLIASPGGIEDAQNNTMNIWPNPVENLLNVDVTNEGKYELVIYNTIGEKIFSENYTNSAQVNTAAFSKGIYLIELNFGNKVMRKKFVKQ